ncbi:hypothetical protein GCM10022377_06840 [Zhihengliuella alba]|uniref:LysM domain-containing protein n=1 Tax=Zhihengliuella alba TaxID=547018 RepID=A0ABP7CUU6_9MICC
MRTALASGPEPLLDETEEETSTRPGKPLPSDVVLALIPFCVMPVVLAAARSHLDSQPWDALLLLPQQVSESGLQAAVVAFLAAVAALACLWWAGTLALAVLGACLRRIRLPRLASGIDRLAPSHMRRIAALVVCFNVATAPAAFGASGTEPAAIESVAAGTATPATAPSPGWVTPTGADRGHSSTSRPLEAPDPAWRPAPPPPALERVLGPTRPVSDEVVVRPGDTLWSLAARHLGPDASDLDIAEEWPRWYHANLGVIGSDPNSLHPGMALRPPTG